MDGDDADVVKDDVAGSEGDDGEIKASGSTEDGNAEEGEEVFYDKKKSFFDSISCEALERSKGNNRPDWRAEKKLNKETFGVSGHGMGGYNYRGGNYRGGRGYNRGGRGGWNNHGGYGGNRGKVFEFWLHLIEVLN